MNAIGPMSVAGGAKMTGGLSWRGLNRAGFDYENTHIGGAEYPHLRTVSAKTFGCAGVIQPSDPDLAKAWLVLFCPFLFLSAGNQKHFEKQGKCSPTPNPQP